MKSSSSATTKRSFLTRVTSGESPGNRGNDGESSTGGGLSLVRRKVLVLAYRFPPQGGGGVQRTLKFVKYLPKRGWLPVVHTVSNPYGPLQDSTLLAEVPQSVKVYRTPTLEFERLRHGADDLLSGPEAKMSAGGSGGTRGKRGGVVRRALKSVGDFLTRHVLIPDPQILWVPLA